MGVHVLGLDVNASGETYLVERVSEADDPGWGPPSTDRPVRAGRADIVDQHLAEVEERASGYGIRLSLAEVKGISGDEVARVVAGQPYHSLADLWQRARISRPVVERLVLAGGFDQLHGVGSARSSTLRHGPPAGTCCCTSLSSTDGAVLERPGDVRGTARCLPRCPPPHRRKGLRQRPHRLLPPGHRLPHHLLRPGHQLQERSRLAPGLRPGEHGPGTHERWTRPS